MMLLNNSKAVQKKENWPSRHSHIIITPGDQKTLCSDQAYCYSHSWHMWINHPEVKSLQLLMTFLWQTLPAMTGTSILININKPSRFEGKSLQHLQLMTIHHPSLRVAPDSSPHQVLRPVIEAKGGWVPLVDVKTDANVTVARQSSGRCFQRRPPAGGPPVSPWEMSRTMVISTS